MINASGSEIDRSDSFKAYKGKVLKSDVGLIFITAAAVSLSFSYVEDSSPLGIWYDIVSIMECYRGSAPYLVNLNKQNYSRWREGMMSRLFGLLNSCPATNVSIFNLAEEQLKTITLNEVLSLLPFGSKTPSIEQIGDGIRKTLFDNDQEKILTFNEAGFGAEELSPLEREICKISGIQIVRNSPDPKTISPRARSLDIQDLEVYLEPLQVRIYENAARLNHKSKIADMMAIYNQKKLEATGSSPLIGNSSDSGTLDSSISDQSSIGRNESIEIDEGKYELDDPLTDPADLDAVDVPAAPVDSNVQIEVSAEITDTGNSEAQDVVAPEIETSSSSDITSKPKRGRPSTSAKRAKQEEGGN
jgi:hypothetical protein